MSELSWISALVDRFLEWLKGKSHDMVRRAC